VNIYRGGIVFEAHRLLHHSTLDLREMKKKKISQSISDFGLDFHVKFLAHIRRPMSDPGRDLHTQVRGTLRVVWP
jgi:hypothetical protein